MKKTMEKKRAIATVFFGSTIPSAIRAYDEIEERIRRKNPGIPVFRAYTSERIRRKPDGTVPSLPELLQRLAVEKYTDIDLLAGFLSAGKIYHDLLRDVSAVKQKMRICVTHPPLSNPAQLRSFLPCAAGMVPPERKPGENVLFMGHGNRDGRSDSAYFATAAEFQKTDPDFHLACVEGNPKPEDVFAELRPGKVWLIPFMLTAGDHTQNDMAGKDPDSWQSRLTNAGFECISILRGLGENPQTAEFFASQVSKNNGKKS